MAKDIAVRGNLAKFGQNPALRQALRGTAGKTIVEAAPRGAILGIGAAPPGSARC